MKLTPVLSEFRKKLDLMMKKARLELLGAYEAYLRPYIGDTVTTAIDFGRPVLDVIMPSE